MKFRFCIIVLLLLKTVLLPAQTDYPNATDKKGLRTGKWIFYLDTNGDYTKNPDSSGFYRIVSFKKGKPSGKVFEYNYRNIKTFEGYFSSLQPDTLNGPAVNYYSKGAKYQEINYERNIITGIVRSYYENGALKFACNYTHSLPDGVYIEYYENGQVHRSGTVKHGKKDGPFIFYTAQGDTDEVRVYKNDVQEGLNRIYKKGKPDRDIPYLNDVKLGLGSVYSENGSVQETTIYFNDKIMKIDSLIYFVSAAIATQDFENGLPAALIMEEYFSSVYPGNLEINDFAASTLASLYTIKADTLQAPYWIKKHFDYSVALSKTNKAPSSDDWHLLSILCETFKLNSEAELANRLAIKTSYENGIPTGQTLQYMKRTADVYFSEKNSTRAIQIYDSILYLIDGNTSSLGDLRAAYTLDYAENLSNHNYYAQAILLLNELKNSTLHTPIYYNVLYTLGNTYNFSNQTDKALAEFISIHDAFGKENRDTLLQLDVLDAMAAYYRTQGNYAAVEKYFNSLQQLSKRAGQVTVDNKYLGNIADFYDEVGRFDKSLAIRQEILNSDKEQLTQRDNLNYLWDSTLLIGLYVSDLLAYARTNELAGNSDHAGENYTEAVSVSLHTFGDSTFYYMRSLAELAGWQMENKNYAQAEINYKEVIRISETYLGQNDLNYFTWLSDLAELYTRTEQYTAALTLAEKVFADEQKNTSVNHPSYVINCERLAAIYDAMGNRDAAYAFYARAMDARVEKIHQDFSVMNANEQETYLATFRYTFDEFNYFALKNNAALPAIAQNVLNYQLANKSMLLFSASAARRAFSKIPHSELSNTYDGWLSLKQLISKYETYSDEALSAAGISIDSLQGVASDMEKQLSLFSAEQQITAQGHTWKDIKNRLHTGEAALEFISIPDYSDQGLNDNQYAALLLRFDDTMPHFIYLADEDTLLHHLKRNNAESDINYVNRIYGFPEELSEEDLYSGHQIYRLLWKPLMKDLENINTIYISQSGFLNKLNMAAIPISATKCIADSYALITLHSLIEIAEGFSDSTLNSAEEIALFGGINYNATQAQLLAAGKQVTYETPAISTDMSAPDTNTVRGGNWKYLPGTLSEVNAIAMSLKEKNIPFHIYSSADATEDLFKSFQGGRMPGVIHIATHGFFMPDSANGLLKGKKMHADHAMFNSGLLLAGGNRSWKGEKFTDLEDGILTAAEVSNVDLTNCKLIVLSACETGLGEIKNDEGVFGLQRALKLAGAENVIMSLWQVSDRETALFMQTFYKYLSEGLTMQKAFSMTRDMMRKRYGPYYWAAFVLIQ